MLRQTFSIAALVVAVAQSVTLDAEQYNQQPQQQQDPYWTDSSYQKGYEAYRQQQIDDRSRQQQQQATSSSSQNMNLQYNLSYMRPSQQELEEQARQQRAAQAAAAAAEDARLEQLRREIERLRAEKESYERQLQEARLRAQQQARQEEQRLAYIRQQASQRQAMEAEQARREMQASAIATKNFFIQDDDEDDLPLYRPDQEEAEPEQQVKEECDDECQAENKAVDDARAYGEQQARIHAQASNISYADRIAHIKAIEIARRESNETRVEPAPKPDFGVFTATAQEIVKPTYRPNQVQVTRDQTNSMFMNRQLPVTYSVYTRSSSPSSAVDASQDSFYQSYNSGRSSSAPSYQKPAQFSYSSQSQQPYQNNNYFTSPTAGW